MPDLPGPESANSYRPGLNNGPSSSQTIPVLANRYLIVGPLGQGGMGTVFLAQDTRLSNRFCVVKKLRLENRLLEEDKLRAMEFFEREAMVLSGLKHPNVVVIQDYFQERGNYFLVMEYVEGDNLHQSLAKRGTPFSEEQVTGWALNILDVLHYLHSHEPPVIYRDIKPSNMMLGAQGDIKLVDFGIARPYAANSENTHVVSGGYSPPEQYWGAADPRSDLYALGSTMYYLLTGREPVALQSCSPRRRNAKVSEYLDKIIQRATAQDVWLRYQTAAEMRQALIDKPRRNFIAIPPTYLLVACLSALISAAAAAFIFLSFADQQQMHSIKTFLFGPLAPQEKLKIAQGEGAGIHSSPNNWAIPLDFATLADSEEVLTDPDGYKPIKPKLEPKSESTNHAWFNLFDNRQSGKNKH